MRLVRCIALIALASGLSPVAPALASIAIATPFYLHWTAPGDDGMSGRAALYDVRYSLQPLTLANFAQATPITGLAPPATAGARESVLVTGLSDGISYYLAIQTADERGNWSALSNIVVRNGPTSGIGPSAQTLSFSAPWPNPAGGSVHWTYTLPQAEDVRVDVFDLLGRHIHTVASGMRAAGAAELVWDLRDDSGRKVDAGLYFVRARIGSNEWTRRLTIVH
jgi:hypothetical protein